MKRLNLNYSLILLNNGYSELNANWNWKNVHSPFARLYYVAEGSARTIVNGVSYKLEPGNLYLTPPFTTHENQCDHSFNQYYIHFYVKTAERETLFDLLELPFSSVASPLDRLLFERLMKINPNMELSNLDPSIYDNLPMFSRQVFSYFQMSAEVTTETEGILMQLLSRFLLDAKLKVDDMDDRIGRCLSYIHQNIDRVITVSDLANIACTSEDHFIRLFKQNVGTTPLDYINQRKVEGAQLQLITTDSSIKDIALDLAIDNSSYFNRLFKRYVGVSPSVFRRKHLYDTRVD